MNITIYSFFTSVIWSSTLVFAIYFFRKKSFFIKQFGVTSLLILYLFCVIRMAIPFEFSFTRVLPAKGIFSVIYRIIVLNKFGGYNLSIFQLIFIIYLAITFILIIRFFYDYFKIMKEISLYSICTDNQCKRILEQVIVDSKKRLNIDIRHTCFVDIPMGIGIFKKSIIIPNGDYSDSELYYILLHEYTHFLNNDLLTKMLVHIFCYIFWWNPIVYLLRKDLSQTLEIKCDLCVTKDFDNNNKIEYLKTIIATLKMAHSRRKQKRFQGIVAFIAKKQKSEVTERFEIIAKLNNDKKKNIVFTVIRLLVFLMIIISSYSFIIQSHYDAPIETLENEPGVHEIRADSAYILKSKDGSYTLFLSNGNSHTIEEEMALTMKSQGFKIIEEEK